MRAPVMGRPKPKPFRERSLHVSVTEEPAMRYRSQLPQLGLQGNLDGTMADVITTDKSVTAARGRQRKHAH